MVIAQNSLSINRIRLEFKDPKQYTVGNRLVVLIESDWNLKIYNWIAYGFRFHCINRIRLEFKDRQEHGPPVAFYVLIESDWNLKSAHLSMSNVAFKVLIESDWNLKDKM